MLVQLLGDLNIEVKRGNACPQLLESRKMEKHWKRISLAMLITYPVIFQGEKLSAAHRIDTAGPLLDCIFYFFKGASPCERLRSSHGSSESSLEPDRSLGVFSII